MSPALPDTSEPRSARASAKTYTKNDIVLALTDPVRREGYLLALGQRLTKEAFFGGLETSRTWRNVVELAFDFSSNRNAATAALLHGALPHIRTMARFRGLSFGHFCAKRLHWLGRIPAHLLLGDGEFLGHLAKDLHQPHKYELVWTLPPALVTPELLCSKDSSGNPLIYGSFAYYRGQPEFDSVLTEDVLLCRNRSGLTALHVALPERIPVRLLTERLLFAADNSGETALEAIIANRLFHRIPEAVLTPLLSRSTPRGTLISELIERAEGLPLSRIFPA